MLCSFWISRAAHNGHPVSRRTNIPENPRYCHPKLIRHPIPHGSITRGSDADPNPCLLLGRKDGMEETVETTTFCGVIQGVLTPRIRSSIPYEQLVIKNYVSFHTLNAKLRTSTSTCRSGIGATSCNVGLSPHTFLKEYCCTFQETL